MRRRHMLPLLAAPSLVAQSDSFASSFRNNFAKHWRDERDYTLAMLDAMPPGDFGFKPNPIQRGFGDQFRHLSLANVAYFRTFNLISPPELAADPLDKEAVRRMTAASFDYVSAVLEKLSEKDLLRADYKIRTPHTGIDVLLRAYTHTAHHRGQAAVYLRVKGFAPAVWRFEPA